MPKKISVLVVHPTGDGAGWRNALAAALPEYNVELWPKVSDAASVRVVACWKQPANFFSSYPNIGLVISLGAGVDHLNSDSSLPKSVMIGRVITEKMIEEMVRYVVHATLDHVLDRARARVAQHGLEWDRGVAAAQHDHRVTILGAGPLGIACSAALQQLGFKTKIWTRSARSLENVISGTDRLIEAVKDATILISLLPLCEETKGILNRTVFKSLAAGAAVVNVARGGHMVEDDLRWALENHLGGAYLDVWSQEPPESHSWIWSHPKVSITAHIASRTDRAEAVQSIAEQTRTHIL